MPSDPAFVAEGSWSVTAPGAEEAVLQNEPNFPEVVAEATVAGGKTAVGLAGEPPRPAFDRGPLDPVPSGRGHDLPPHLAPTRVEATIPKDVAANLIVTPIEVRATVPAEEAVAVPTDPAPEVEEAALQNEAIFPEVVAETAASGGNKAEEAPRPASAPREIAGPTDPDLDPDFLAVRTRTSVDRGFPIDARGVSRGPGRDRLGSRAPRDRLAPRARQPWAGGG